MSGQKHATVSLWQREEDGSYVAEMNGWRLHVKWTPERRAGDPHGFSWSAERGSETMGSEKLFEEMNVAMATAEDAALGTDTRDADKSA